MNAGTRLIVVMALIWALAAAGGMGGPAAKVASRPPGPDCDEFGCGMNHNETLVRDAGAAEAMAPWSRWLRSVLAFVHTKVRGGGGCDEWGCGANHNESLVRDAGSIEPAAPWSRWLRSVLAFVHSKVRGPDCDEFGCGTNHNETMVRDAAR